MIGAVLVGLKRYKVYPLDLLVETAFPFITIIAVPSLWLYLGSVGSYSPHELFLYTAGSFFLTFLLGSLAFEVEKAIRTGYFEVYQTKPINYAYMLALEYLGKILPRLVTSLLTLFVLYILFNGKNIFLYLLGTVLAFLFYTLLELVIGYLAAWYYKVWGVHFMVVYFPSLLLGGSLIPLDLLPPWIQDLSIFFPYRYLHFELAKTLLGHTPNLLPLFLWTVALFILERILYRKTLKRLEAWGG